MASGFQGGGDVCGMGASGGSAVRGCPIQVPYQQRSDVGVAAGVAGVGITGGGILPKRTMADLHRQLQQQAMFVRSVRQKTLLPQSFPMSPFSPVELFSPSTSSSSSSNSVVISSTSSSGNLHPQSQGPAASVSNAPASFPSRNGSYLFLQQQLLQQGYNRGVLDGTPSLPPPLPAVADQHLPQMKPESAASAMKNRLQELEKQLLDDSNDEEEEASISGSVVTAAEWSETMQSLISPSSCCSSSPKTTHQSPSPSSTCSSSSSSSSSTPSRQLLLDAASAIADGNIDPAAATLDRLSRSAANPRGDPDQRLTAYMVAALRARIDALSFPAPAAEYLPAPQVLYESSPCFFLGFVAANLAILDATRGHPKIHIVDFDVGHGLQYAALVTTLADRPASSGRPAVRITAVADPTFSPAGGGNCSTPEMVGEQIERLAERAGVRLRFRVLRRRACDLDAAALGCEPGEALAVNFAFLLHRLPDESVTPENPRDWLLRRARALAPRVVTLVEPELSCNTAPFAARFAEASAHCAALFESLEATLPRESPDRARVEDCIGRRAANSVAREGRDRVDRCEVFGKWRARMGMAGYRPSPLGPAVLEPVRARLAGKHPGFTVKEDAGAVFLGWSDRVLTVTSAWY